MSLSRTFPKGEEGGIYDFFSVVEVLYNTFRYSNGSTIDLHDNVEQQILQNNFLK